MTVYTAAYLHEKDLWELRTEASPLPVAYSLGIAEDDRAAAEAWAKGALTRLGETVEYVGATTGPLGVKLYLGCVDNGAS
jgi:hypothetical protein